MLLMLICALLVTAQAGGVHLHHCPDDGPQSVSVHGPDWQPHDCTVPGGHGFAAPHADQVIFLSSEAPLKKRDAQAELPDLVWASAPALLPAAVVPAVATPSAAGHVPVPRRYSLQPPARGPPR